MPEEKPFALLLAGGKSKRLGRDKRFLQIGENDLFGHSIRILQRCGLQVIVSGCDPAMHGIDVPWFPDEKPGLGPMGGILTALHQLNSPLLAFSCDMPCMTPEMLIRMLTARNKRGTDVCMTTFRQEQTGHIEALVAVYETSTLPLLEESAARGDYKLSRAVPPEYRLHIDYDLHSQGSYFVNINYPEDVQMMHKCWEDLELG